MHEQRLAHVAALVVAEQLHPPVRVAAQEPVDRLDDEVTVRSAVHQLVGERPGTRVRAKLDERVVELIDVAADVSDHGDAWCTDRHDPDSRPDLGQASADTLRRL